MSVARAVRERVVSRGQRPITLESQGRVHRVRLGEPPKSKKPSKRGTVRGFSRAAAARCIEFINRVDWPFYIASNSVRMLTLTYPVSIAPTLNESISHYNRFRDWLRRTYPDVSYIRIAERQVNGSLHWHGLLTGLDAKIKDLAAFRAAWAKAIRWEGCGLQVNFLYVPTPTDAARYVAGYAIKGAKEEEKRRREGGGSYNLDSGSYSQEMKEEEESGFEWWGVHNRSKLKMASPLEAVLPYGPHVYRWRRAVRASVKAKIRRLRASEGASKVVQMRVASELRGLERFYQRLRSEEVKGWLLYTDQGDQWVACFAYLADE